MIILGKQMWLMYIRTLRNKLKEVDADSFVQTVRGVGYVLRDPYEN